MRVSRVANTNASALRPAQREELQVRARVRLHRAGDVAQQHDAAADDAPAPVREPDRLAAGAQAAAQRAAQVDVLAAAGALGAARAARRRRELEPRHQRVEQRELAGLERVEALAAQALLVAGGDGHRRLARPSDSPSPRGTETGAAGRARPRRGAVVPALVGAAPARVVVGGRRLGVVEAMPEHAEEHAVERPRLRLVGDEDRARGPVQARARDGPVSVSAAAKRAARSGVIGSPASCRRRPNVATTGAQIELDQLHRHARLPSPAARTTSWSSPYLSTEPSVRSIVSASSSATPSSYSAASQSIASAIPGGFWMSPSRIRAHRGRRPARPAARRPPARAGARSRSRAAGGVVDPLYRQRRLTASCRSRVRLDVSTIAGGCVALDRAELRDRHRGLGEQLEQERLEVVVGAIDLVDQQHRGPRARMLQRPQQRPARSGSRARTARPRPARSSLASASRIASSWRG